MKKLRLSQKLISIFICYKNWLTIYKLNFYIRANISFCKKNALEFKMSINPVKLRLYN